jgi:hypothetical protein
MAARVRDWYRAAQKWQEEAISVTKTGSVSTRRNAKLKKSGSASGYVEESVDLLPPNIDVIKINELVTANVLSKVRFSQCRETNTFISD